MALNPALITTGFVCIYVEFIPFAFSSTSSHATACPAHLHIVGERVHEQPFLDELLPLGILQLQVAVVIVGHDDAVRVVGQLDDVAVVVTHHSLAVDAARGRVHQDVPALQLIQYVLV